MQHFNNKNSSAAPAGTTLHVKDSKLNFVRQGERIGAGFFAETFINKYNGTNPFLRELVSTNANLFIVLKELIQNDKDDPARIAMRNKTNLNEMAIVAKLHANCPSNQPVYFARGAVVRLDDDANKECIVSELVAYSHDKENLPCCVTVADYMREISFNARCVFRAKEESALKAAMRAAIPKLMADIAEGMHLAQYQLHGIGIMHGDTALRNLMLARPVLDGETVKFTTRIIDFGISRPLSESGIFTYVLSATEKDNLILPWYMMDKHSITFKQHPDKPGEYFQEYSINTDLFAKKVAMIEMLGLMLGYSYTSICNEYLTPKSRATVSDEEVLQYYLGRIKELLKPFDDIDERKYIVTTFIEVFGTYLTTSAATIPANKDELAEIRARDDFEFQSALTRLRNSHTNQIGAEQLLRAVMPESDLLPNANLDDDNSDKSEPDVEDHTRQNINSSGYITHVAAGDNQENKGFNSPAKKNNQEARSVLRSKSMFDTNPAAHTVVDSDNEQDQKAKRARSSSPRPSSDHD